MSSHKVTFNISGREMSFETGGFAQQATSAVMGRYGDSVVLATVVIGKEDPKKDFFPLSIEYQERLYAGGRIKGSRWVKREGKGADAEILSGRLIDRSVRPLFPEGFRNETQIIVTVLSTDTANDVDVLALNTASAAIALTGINWNGPVTAVRVGLKDGQIEINPQNGNRQGTELDLVVSSTKDLVTMLEAGAKQVSEELLLEGIKKAHLESETIRQAISDLCSKVEVKPYVFEKAKKDSEFVKEVHKLALDKVKAFMVQYATKQGNGPTLEDIALEVSSKYSDDKTKQASVIHILEELLHDLVRQDLLKGKRADNRSIDEIRPLTAMVGVLPRVHGSAIFQRGQTQALTITTLGDPSLYQSFETAEGEEVKRYMHHYNFPPFSTGETGRVGSPGRREIGHGALAERALIPVIPQETDFPYAIRVVSEILSSNGSTSMASTCASTLSLMDAGVPLLAPVAGISVGLVTQKDYPTNSEYQLLVDIVGLEDHHGDMDFKVAGTTTGVTAIQLDVKVPGITLEIIENTFKKAKDARLKILEVIHKAIAEPRKQVSALAPKIFVTSIPTDKIGELIGPGGKNIKRLMADTETRIDTRDDGKVFVTGVNLEKAQQAVDYIESMSKEVEIGQVYEGQVVSIQPFGAFVNILPGRDGLVHVSRMDAGFVGDPRQFVSEGQTVKVWVSDYESDTGRIGLSMIFDAQGNPAEKTIPIENQSQRGNFDDRQSPRRDFRNNDFRPRGKFTAPRQKRRNFR